MNENKIICILFWLIFIATLTLYIMFKSSDKTGCCSSHGGIQACDLLNQKIVCKDNTYSKKCKCL